MGVINYFTGWRVTEYEPFFIDHLLRPDKRPGKVHFHRGLFEQERGVGRMVCTAFIINIFTWQKTHLGQQPVRRSLPQFPQPRRQVHGRAFVNNGGEIISCSTPEEQVIIVSARKWWSQAVGANLKMTGLRLVKNKHTVKKNASVWQTKAYPGSGTTVMDTSIRKRTQH